MAAPATIDDYLASFPTETAARLQQVRAALLAAAPGAEERISYGIGSIRFDGRNALYWAGWKSHIGIYPVPALEEPLELHIAGFRAAKDTLKFPHGTELPLGLITEVAAAVIELYRERV